MSKKFEKYISAMNNINFDENLKSKIMLKISEKQPRKIDFFPKAIISLAGVQMLLCFFTTTCVGYITI